MILTRHTPLQRAPDLEIELTAVTEIELIVNGECVRGHPLTLAVLDTFSTRKTVEQGLEELRPRLKGARAWLELTQHVTELYRAGVLQGPDQQTPILNSHSGWFGAAPVHIRMLNDRARTATFQQAIRETVTPEDVVVDIGTGTGVLAVTAALAGAKHVYAIESSTMGRLAQQAFAVNGLSDRITLVPGRSEQIDLPEKADILVSEIIGNDPLDEEILETTDDAVKRLLKPNARLIPESLSIYGLPVCGPADWLQAHIFTRASAAQWQAWYEMDFSVLAEASHQQNHSVLTNTYDTRDWLRLSEPVLLAELDLKSVEHKQIEMSAQVTAINTGVLNSVIVFFETKLSKSVQLSIHPSKATAGNSWASKIWIAGDPVTLAAGEPFKMSYAYGDKGSSFEINGR